MKTEINRRLFMAAAGAAIDFSNEERTSVG